MPDHIIYHIIYVIISGSMQFLPVSTRAHQMLYEILTGATMDDPAVTLVIHLGAIAAVCLSCKELLRRLRIGKRIEKRSRKARSRDIDRSPILDGRVIRTAALPILLSAVLYRQGVQWISGLAGLALTSFLSGSLLFFPQLMPRGNKDSRTLSRLDSICMGLGGALAVIPGFSRVGGILSAGLARGTRLDYLTEIALILSLPALTVFCVFDILAVAKAGAAITIWSFLWYLLLCLLSFGTSYLGIMLLRFLSVKADTVPFSYYSWGVALFTFVLYLLI